MRVRTTTIARDPALLLRAKQLLAEAATLDLDQRQLLVRCRLGGHGGWWELGQVHELLELATDVTLARDLDGTAVVVIDGIDVYRFDVT